MFEGGLYPRRVAIGFEVEPAASGDCILESGGDSGSSGRSSLNFDIVRAGVPEDCRTRGGATRCAGGGCRDIDSREVFENETSDGVDLP